MGLTYAISIVNWIFEFKKKKKKKKKIGGAFFH